MIVAMTPRPITEVLASNVRRYRTAAGWTQGELSSRLNDLHVQWTRLTVLEVEAGRRKVAIDELLTLAQVFGKPILTMVLPIDEFEVALGDGATLSRASLVSLFEHGQIESDDTGIVRKRQLVREIAELQKAIDAFDREQQDREERAVTLHSDIEARRNELDQIEEELDRNARAHGVRDYSDGGEEGGRDR